MTMNIIPQYTITNYKNIHKTPLVYSLPATIVKGSLQYDQNFSCKKNVHPASV